MTMDNTQFLLPNRIYIFLAPLGTAAPTGVDDAPAAGWVNVGYTAPDSLSFSTEPEFQPVETAQSDYPAMQYQTSESGSVSAVLKQWNKHNLRSVFGGGTVTSDEAGVFKFVPPKIGGREEVALMTHAQYGDKKYRFVYPRAMQMEGVQLDLHKGGESTLPLSMGILGSDLLDPWYLITNDPAFGPVTP